MFTDKNIFKLFTLILSTVLGYVIVLQVLVWKYYRQLSMAIIIVSIIFTILILIIFQRYFLNQNQLIESAINQVNLFLSGSENGSIACDQEGTIFKLFHAINAMHTISVAQFTREQNIKIFLRNTISDISHQLKTPLTALNIYIDILRDETTNPVLMNEFLSLSEQEIERIEMLVKNLLKITKLDTGTITLEQRSENIADIFLEIKRHFDFRANQEQKTIELSGPGRCMFLCDRLWFVEAMSNIVKNALDHTSVGGRIEIEWKKTPVLLQIIVKDNGCGIHPEDIYHIFKRFYCSRFSKDNQGIGLGLPLAKAIIEAHHGSITVDSTIEKGSSFNLRFLIITKM